MRRITWVLLVALVLGATGVSAAVADPAQLEQQLRENEREQRETRAELREIEADARVARDRLRAAEAELAAAREALDRIGVDLAIAELVLADARLRVDLASDRLADAEDELDRAEQELAERQTRFEGRVRSSFMYGHHSLIEAFAGVRELPDLMTSSHLVGSVMAADRDLVIETEQLRAQVDERRATAEDHRRNTELATLDAVAAAAEVRAALSAQEQHAAEVEASRAEHARALAALQADAAAVTEHLESLVTASAQVEAELREAERRAAERRAAERRAAEQAAAAAAARETAERQAAEQAAAAAGSGPATQTAPEPPATAAGQGGWQRPSSGRVTSRFGQRLHPVRGIWLMHTGVDLAAGHGSPIRASRAGTVSSAAWRGGYGNTVVIDHGGGLATLYAHLSAFEVAAGQQVGQGQVVGREGMTGTATGPHLHFEVRVNGAPVNPCGYIAC